VRASVLSRDRVSSRSYRLRAENCNMQASEMSLASPETCKDLPAQGSNKLALPSCGASEEKMVQLWGRETGRWKEARSEESRDPSLKSLITV
jgi:hypothetical protein